MKTNSNKTLNMRNFSLLILNLYWVNVLEFHLEVFLLCMHKLKFLADDLFMRMQTWYIMHTIRCISVLELTVNFSEIKTLFVSKLSYINNDKVQMKTEKQTHRFSINRFLY